MGMLPMGNRSIGVVTVDDRAASILRPMPTPKHVVRKSCGPIRSGAVYVGYSGRLASRGTPWWPGSKKRSILPPLSATLVPPDAQETLELDELWSFVQRKVQQVWVWIALCRRTRQVVAFALGDRSK